MANNWRCLFTFLFPPVWFGLPVALVSIVFIVCYSNFMWLVFRMCDRRSDQSVIDDRVRHSLCALGGLIGRVWHGYDKRNVDKLFLTQPAVLVGYHGTAVIDIFYLLCEMHLIRPKCVEFVGERMFFDLPVFFQYPGLLLGVKQTQTVDDCIEIIQRGKLLLVYPGGSYESSFSDQSYCLKWRNRVGFAKAALAAQVPLVPIFTANIQEAFWMVFNELKCTIDLYERTKIPLFLPCGGIPVKLKLFVGKPIIANPSLTAEQLADQTKAELVSLIKQNQRIPGSVLGALLDRFR